MQFCFVILSRAEKRRAELLYKEFLLKNSATEICKSGQSTKTEMTSLFQVKVSCYSRTKLCDFIRFRETYKSIRMCTRYNLHQFPCERVLHVPSEQWLEQLISDAWKMPQNDYTETSDAYDVDKRRAMTKHDSLLISEEVKKDIQHTAFHSNNRVNAEETAVAKGRDSQPVSQASDDHRNTDFADSPVLKLDVTTIFDESGSPSTMVMIPISGTDSDAVTVATNYGQVPVENNHQNKRQKLHGQSGVGFDGQFLRMPNSAHFDKNLPRPAFRGVPRTRKFDDDLKRYDPVWNRDSSAEAPGRHRNESNSYAFDNFNFDTKIDGTNRRMHNFQEDSSSTAGSLPPPLKDSTWTKHGPTERTPPSFPDTGNRYKPKPFYQPKGAFGRMYFSKNSPDLRFKRDLSRVGQSSVDKFKELNLNLHNVNMNDEAMYECQVKPLGGPARWGRAHLNVHGLRKK